MKRSIAVAAIALCLSACNPASVATTTVPTVKAQQAVDLAVAAYKVDLDAENIYLRLAPCGLAASPPPPLCASYAVGVKWKAIDVKVRAAIADTQAKINTLGTDPTVINAAVAAMQLAVAELDNFATPYKVTK